MSLLKPGYWHSTYWPKSYWNVFYWQRFSLAAALGKIDLDIESLTLDLDIESLTLDLDIESLTTLHTIEVRKYV